MSGPYEAHAFVCLGGKTCPGQGGEAIFVGLKERIAERGLKDRVRINKAGCMSQCGHGPMVCVYPADVWYAGVQPDDLDAIADHLEGGAVVEDRRYTPPQPGANKVS